MTTFVLVHGAFHGAWCWVKLLPELQSRGHKGIALDMPGNGDDRTPLAQVTFDDYVKRIGDTLMAEREPAVLVGHSLGSQAVSQAAERYPDKIRRLVYLGGCIPKDGTSLYVLLQMLTNPGAPVRTEIPSDHPWHGVSQKPVIDQAHALYYNDCSAEDIAFAKDRLCEQANAPRVAKLQLTPERFGKVRKALVGCSLDKANTPAVQKANLELVPCETYISIPTSHSPFFSNPKLLAETLTGLI